MSKADDLKKKIAAGKKKIAMSRAKSKAIAKGPEIFPKGTRRTQSNQGRANLLKEDRQFAGGQKKPATKIKPALTSSGSSRSKIVKKRKSKRQSI